MVKKFDRNKLRQKKHRSIRKKIVGTAERPRLAVYRSLQNIFVQVIDDTTGNTLVSASTIEKGAKITDGPVSPHDILKIKGLVAAQQFILESVQQVYREQGVPINDKHIEIIVKQMFQKVKIREAGDTLFLEDELIDKKIVERENAKLIEKGKTPATYEPVIQGITKAAVNTESFISASSFQETTKVLANAAVEGKIDKLEGLKENVIIGKKIPSGTGFKDYKHIKVTLKNEVLEDEVPAEEIAEEIIVVKE